MANKHITQNVGMWHTSKWSGWLDCSKVGVIQWIQSFTGGGEKGEH